jgi:hypothetical protein
MGCCVRDMERACQQRTVRRPDQRIPVLTLACGLRSDVGVDAPAQQREWLRRNDFKRFVSNVNEGPNQQDFSSTFEGIRERIKHMGGDLLLALAMAVFTLAR